MKKKSLVVALLASMMLSMTACGSDATETNVEVETGEVETGDVEAETDVEEETAAEPETNLEENFEVKKAEAEEVESAEVEEDAEVEAEEETEEEAEDYTKGTLNGNVFESEWMGIRFEAPEGYSLSTEEEIEAALLAGGELMYEEDVEELLDYTKLTTVYEMIAQESEYGDPNVSLTVVKTPYDAKTFVDATLIQAQSVEGISITLLNEEAEIVELAGKEFEKYATEMNYDGYLMLQDYYFTRQDDRMIYMVLTYTDEAAAEEIMSGFSAY
ncbi:MAG: hypothetical protein IJO97_03075 [Lachnospiraceae bacterium]|nr:hypothetical protein [Lachnospiraceae bacterium]